MRRESGGTSSLNQGGVTETPFSGFLGDVRVVELGGELGEYCGKVVAGLGADVIRVESPEGSPTRHYGPFYGDREHRERSLYFWHYNFAKRSVTIDLNRDAGLQELRDLIHRSDVVLDTWPPGY